MATAFFNYLPGVYTPALLQAVRISSQGWESLGNLYGVATPWLVLTPLSYPRFN